MQLEAVGMVEVLSLARRDFLDVVLRNRTATEHLLSTLSHMVRRLSDIDAGPQTDSVEGRVARNLLEYADQYGEVVDGTVEVQGLLLRPDLGALVGVTRPVFNRLLRGWEDQGIVGRRGRRLAILDPERLRQKIS